MKGKRKKKKKSIWTTFAASRNSVPEQMEALSFRGFLTYTKQFSGIGKGASVWMLLSGTRLEESTLFHSTRLVLH